MRLTAEYSELPKFLGCYEAALHSYIERFCVQPYTVVLNIGCAEGYYSVGFARTMPNAQILAFDTDPEQQVRCRANADLNGVGNRITVAGAFNGEMFNNFAGQRGLVICDIEGGEVDLLQPGAWGGLRAMDLIVELHEGRVEDLVGLFAGRFSETHDIVHVPRQLIQNLAPIEKLFDDEMDQLAAIFENRFGRQSWLVLTCRAWTGDPHRTMMR
jgi:hypothetical protein